MTKPSDSSCRYVNLMNPVTLLKITFALSLAFTFVSTLYALRSSK